MNIGTYVHDSSAPADDAPEGYNRFSPIATATMSTLVFDVVHMFSARGISAVPIVDEDGIVVNLYETVDVIVSDTELVELKPGWTDVSCSGSRPQRPISIAGLDNSESAESASA